MTIGETHYIVSKLIKGKRKPLFEHTSRTKADEFASDYRERGVVTVVFECRCISVCNPTVAAQQERTQRIKQKKRKHA